MYEDKYLFGELINIEMDFYQATDILVSELLSYGVRDMQMLELRCSEILTLRHKLDLFLILQNELGHYQITSLISFWDSLFHEIKTLSEEKSRNTSWLSSQFNNFKDQHNIVIKMLKEYYDGMPNKK